ncbi:MAG: hypothetical protein M1282_00480 [Chloroflexi bacterium]|nr:hypothetical protein [Chloroflexota bacterium]
MKKHLIWILPVLIAGAILIICGLAAVSLAIGDMQRETLVSTNEGTYSMDSPTIFQSLAAGKTDVFIRQMTTPSATSVNLPPVRWTEANYLLVASAFSQMVWHESFDSWKLERLHFGLDCKDESLGPQWSSLDVYKAIQSPEGGARIERTLFISPDENQVSWNGAEYYPDVEGKSFFNPSEIKIHAEEVLHIAETQGGEKERQSVDNVCQIDLSIVAGLSDNNWIVRYTGYHGDYLFQIEVNQQTGEYQIVYPKP